jgi:2-(1,2-epoxy-1,2-dihydrophenyl)acetyl-CoA isomerase
MNEAIVVTRDGALATVTLNRPQSLNALDVAMIDAMVEVFRALAADASVRCVVVRGAGAHFMAGGDIRTFQSRLAIPPEERGRGFQRMVEHLHAAIETLTRMPKPVVASAQGAVAGFGLSLFLACDLAVADESAFFTCAYRHIGLTPDGGCTFFLPRLVGTRKAMEIVLLGERFDVREAQALGLLNRVAPAGELERATAELVAKLLSGPQAAIAGAKRLVGGSLERTLSEQLQAEAVSFGSCSTTDDFAEGVEAFLAKRAPRFGAGRTG